MGVKPKGLGKVVKILNPYEVVVNRGKKDGIAVNDEFVVYTEGEELLDPDTGESLGTLEIVRGRAYAKHVQRRLTTLRSRESRPETRDRRRPEWRTLLEERSIDRRLSTPSEEYVEEVVAMPAPFENVQLGDLARKL